ncbi:gamma-glutamyltransferase [Sphingomonas sp. BT-65]|uniref:gamma-glutamyltransferase n=1 Tax=Sphingomonas sp. BT-65 TaxID=2989821 RepID=UPI0022368804|nr:gamma-glutamyltransferase [Sphingomonas sp. BT-65]MCW4460921.1 gamma-glutamyltransferase [Sphingomonas sp. BT-65]
MRLDALAGIASPQPTGHHTATVVAVDRWGNVAALVHSSNTMIWGDSGMVVGGIPIPMAAGIYQQRLAAIVPGGRLPSDMAPLMLLRDGRPSVAIAGLGSSVVPESVRLMIGFSRGEAMTDWLAAPPLLLNFEQAGLPLAEQDELIPTGAYPEQVVTALRAMGFRFRTVDSQRAGALRGTVAAVRLGSKGVREAAEVPEVLAFAETE